MAAESSKNRLKEVRQSEGLTKAELARLTGVSAKTITNIERNSLKSRRETKQKIILGLNRNPNRTGEYAFEDVFPSQ